MYVCPVCKEANEEYRTYCKECGTWLLNTKYPSKPIEKAKKNQHYHSRNGEYTWLKSLFIIGAILFVPLALLGGKENIYGLFALYGLVGFGLTIILAIVLAVTRSFKERKNGVGILLVTSVLLFIISTALNPNSLEAHNSVKQVNSGQVVLQNKQVYAIGDTVNAGKLSYIVKEAYQQHEINSTFGKITTNGVFVVMTVDVLNNDNSPRFVEKGMIKLYDSEGRSFDPNIKADLYINESSFFLKNINPGISTEAKIVFEVPTNAMNLKLEVTSGSSFSKDSQYILIGSL
jgi:hypothetical protein